MGDKMTFEEFRYACECGALIDYDGMAEWLDKDGNEINLGFMAYLYPSQFLSMDPSQYPEGAVAIQWFNR